MWLFGLGLAMTAFWLNREEAVWILPMLLSVLVVTAVRMPTSGRVDRMRGLAVLALPLVLWQAGLAAVAGANHAKYGEYGVVEIKSSEFKAAWGALSRAGAADYRADDPDPHIAENAESLALGEQARKPAGEGADDEKPDQIHGPIVSGMA